MAATTPSYTDNEFLQADWIDPHTGEIIQMLAPDERMPLSETSGRRLHLGKYLVGAITGKWPEDSEVEKLAMGGSVNVFGGILVPDALSSEVIDLARAKTVVMRAGARTVPMTTDSLVMARVTADPTLQLKGENSAFTGSQVSLDGITLNSRTLGNYVVASRELIEDAPNASDVIQHCLAAALAVSIDTLALVGQTSGGPFIDGIVNASGIGTTGSIGTLSWSHLQTGVKAIQAANGQPNAYVASPTTVNRLASLTSGDGANSAKLWLGPPRNVEPLEELMTTTCPDGTIVVGDFTKSIFGIRQEALIEVTREAVSTFEKHQVGIKITWRGDFNLTYPSHFYTLTGITG